MGLFAPHNQRRTILPFIAKNGESATIYTYAVSGEDAYGNNTYTETQTSVTAVLSFSRRSMDVGSEAHGQEFIIEAEVYVSKDDFDSVTGLTYPLSVDDKRPKVVFATAQYDIFEIEDPGIGLVRFVCRKMRA